MKLIVINLILFLLGGCASYDAAKSSVLDAKRAVNDEQLDAAVNVTCNDVAVGAVRRRWNGDFTKWAEFCRDEGIKIPDLK